MKRIIFSLFLLLSFTTLSFGRIIAEGETYSPLGKFTVQASDEPMMILGNGLQTYLITYENSPMVLKVIVDKQKKCKNYIVVSDNLSIMYTCNGEYLGVKLLDEKYKEAGLVTNTEALNKSSYFHQKLLNRGMVTEVEAFKLIAVFFPELLEG